MTEAGCQATGFCSVIDALKALGFWGQTKVRAGSTAQRRRSAYSGSAQSGWPLMERSRRHVVGADP